MHNILKDLSVIYDNNGMWYILLVSDYSTIKNNYDFEYEYSNLVDNFHKVIRVDIATNTYKQICYTYNRFFIDIENYMSKENAEKDLNITIDINNLKRLHASLNIHNRLKAPLQNILPFKIYPLKQEAGKYINLSTKSIHDIINKIIDKESFDNYLNILYRRVDTKGKLNSWDWSKIYNRYTDISDLPVMSLSLRQDVCYPLYDNIYVKQEHMHEKRILFFTLFRNRINNSISKYNEYIDKAISCGIINIEYMISKMIYELLRNEENIMEIYYFIFSVNNTALEKYIPEDTYFIIQELYRYICDKSYVITEDIKNKIIKYLSNNELYYSVKKSKIIAKLSSNVLV